MHICNKALTPLIVVALFVAASLLSPGCAQNNNQLNQPPPGLGLANAPWAETATAVVVSSGKTRTLDFVYETKQNGPGNLSLTILNIGQPHYGGPLPPELSMPEGLNVSVQPKQIRAYPNRTYHFTISINTSAELEPGTYRLAWRSAFEPWGELVGPITVTVEPAG